MKRYYIIIAAIAISFALNANMLTSPKISPDGTYILFNFNDDIYKVDINGGNAYQLTVNPGYDGHPILSDDGRYMAFTSDRNGIERKIFIIDLQDNTVNQLTFGRSYDYPMFFDGNELIFQSAYRIFGTYMFSVDIMGGIPKLYYYGPSVAMSKSDSMAVYMYGKISSYRFKYKGSADYDLYLKNLNSDKPAEKLTDNDYQEIFPTIIGDNIYFLSAEKGIYNIKVKNIVTQDEDWITDENENINSFFISANEDIIVYEKGFSLYKLNRSMQKTEMLDINILPDRVNPAEFPTTVNKVSNFAISLSNDSLMIINSYGELFCYYPEIYSENLTNIPSWEKEPFFTDSLHYYYISNRNGYFDIYLGEINGTYKNITNTDVPENILLVSDEDTGNYDKVMIFRTPEGLYIYEKNHIKLIEKGQIQNAVISPNHRYIAFLKINRDGQSYAVENMYIFDRKKDIVKQLSRTGFSMKPIMFSEDCTKLYFTYSTNIERMEYYTDLYCMELVKPNTEYKQLSVKSEQKKDDIEIDYNDIHKRIKKIGEENNISIALGSPNRDYIILIQNYNNKNKFYKINTLQEKGVFNYEPEFLFETEKISSADISPSGKQLFYIVSDKLYSASLGSPPVPVNFSAEIKVDNKERYRELFDEAWLVLNDYFYDKDFHGSDWNEIKEKYSPYVDDAENFGDLSDIVYRMFGELNASHLGFRENNGSKLSYGDLGIEYEEDNGYPRITYIFSGGAMDKSDINVKTGDYIISIDGNDLKNRDMAEFLLNKTGKKVSIGLSDKPGIKETLVTVIPADMWDSYYRMYDRWVERRAFITDSVSNGTIGYIHIQSMGNRDFWKFQDKILYENADKDALVLDIRNNGGGFSYDYYITLFSRQAHLYKYGRYDDVKQTTPLLRWNKPVIMLINEASFSNAEMFPHVFKSMGIGKVVGMPTAGGVIGTYNTRLFDGTFYRIPALGVYSYEGVNLENNPTEPDIFIDNAPEDYRDDSDSQLIRAIEELMK